MTAEVDRDHSPGRDGHQPPPFSRAAWARRWRCRRLRRWACPGCSRRKRPALWPRPPAGVPLRSAFVYFPNGAIPASWWPSGEGTDFQFKKTLQPLEPLKGLIQVARRPQPSDGRGWSGRGRRPCAGQRDVPDRRPVEEECDRHPRRHLHRPGDGSPGRSPHAVPVARAGVRLGQEVRRVRFGVFLRLSVQPFLELGDDADAAGIEPAAGLRATLRHRQAGPAPGEPAASPPGAAIHPRLRPRRRALDAAEARLGGREEARPVPGRGSRDRSEDREGRAVRRRTRPAGRDAGGRPRWTTRNTSSSCSTC